MITKKYRMENLGCANCAAKMENKINALPQVQEATLAFATKQLRVTAEDPDSLLEEMQAIAASIESAVVIRPWSRGKGHDHEHAECGCGHHHDHEHAECGCGHHHDHEHAECGCGHHHDHEHEHHHEHDHHHDHSHSQTHDHGHDHEEIDVKWVIIGAVLFVISLILEWCTGIEAGSSLEWGSICIALLMIAAYIILGKEIIWAAVKGIGHGQIFDENFLMSIATLGAIGIGEYAEAVGVMLFFRVGEYFEHRAVEKSRSAIMEAVDMRPEMVQRVKGEESELIPAEEAQKGDIVMVRPGDRIPLDGTIVEGETQIDTSPVTGEPVPMSAKIGDAILSGCINNTGLIQIQVEKVLEESMVTRILESVENAAASKPQMERFITRFAKIYTPIVVAIALLTAIIPSLISGNWGYWVYTALTFLVISCPCAMVLSVPLAFFSGIGSGSRKGILFKGGTALEALTKIKAVVMDKTGTITQGNFVVQSIHSFGAWDTKQILEAAAVCEGASTHPIARSILKEAEQQLEMLPAAPESIEEIAGKGIKAQYDGKELLCGNDKLMQAYGIGLPSEQGAYGTHVYVAVDGDLAGEILIADTIKKEAASAIHKLREKHKLTAMLTGDAKQSAQAVADTVGVQQVRAELLPQDKLTALREIREQEGGVMFVGDGINDAPVLAGADVGAAMGSGSDAAIEAADVVFMTSSVEAIPQAIDIAENAMRVAKQNVIFALLVKVAVMALGLAGIANMWLAVFADSGVALLCVLNSIRILRK
ncbi:MAG: cadmium-translocating P-type ATPase [Lachnospiraceae bacterium]|jgi:Cd2+/Zn2+-exporting ATPase|nr:cadmium-translocating P-type ATPase [Lachnospiraceae bacterium]